jgi:hypothetical protein
MLVALLLALGSTAISRDADATTTAPAGVAALSGMASTHPAATGTRADWRLLAKRGAPWTAGVGAATVSTATCLSTAPCRWAIRATAQEHPSNRGGDACRVRGPPQSM